MYTPGPVRPGDAEKFLRDTATEPDSWNPVFRKYQTIRKVALPGRCLAQGSSTWQAPHIRITIPKSFLRAHPIQAKKMWRIVFSARSPWPRCPLMAHGRSRVLGIVTRLSSGYVTWQAQYVIQILAKSPGGASSVPCHVCTRGRRPCVRSSPRLPHSSWWLCSTCTVAVSQHLAGGLELADALALGSACVFLSQPHLNQPGQSFRRPAYGWWIRHKWARSRCIITASVVAGILFGSVIAIRAHILHGRHPNSTGLVDGVIAGIVVGLSAVIARIFPRPDMGH